MFKLKYGSSTHSRTNISSSTSLESLAQTLNDHDFCYAVLHRVSRSFAMVIQQLPESLRDAVCIFYLVLRGLDSIEDDMTYDPSLKIPLLQSFYTHLNNDEWYIENVGDAIDYRILLKYFYKVIHVYKSLDRGYRHIIADITRKMGIGMSEFADKVTSIDTIANYNLYCHYVAGLVGVGLSELFSSSGLEAEDLAHQHRLSNSMGLFLQKTNIIRDYLEDSVATRTWWPEEIWGPYARAIVQDHPEATYSLSIFAQYPHSSHSHSCLNHMVNDALSHVVDSLDYLSRLRHKQIFEFCAIPQTMAIATLAAVYSNPLVFQKNVKVRRGLAAKMMLESSSLIQVHSWFRYFAEEFSQKLRVVEQSSSSSSSSSSSHSNGTTTTATTSSTSLLHHQLPSSASLNATPSRTRVLLDHIFTLTRPGHSSSPYIQKMNILVWFIFFIALYYLFTRLRSMNNEEGSSMGRGYLGQGPGFGLMSNGLDVMAVFGCFVSIAYLFGFFGIQYV